MLNEKHTGERLVINRAGERYITEEQNTRLTNIARTVREQGTGNIQHLTLNRDQGTGSGDQGAGNPAAGSGGWRPMNIRIELKNESGTNLEMDEQPEIKFDLDNMIVSAVIRQVRGNPEFRKILQTGGRG